ncbi:MAG TPA: hypothetical protein VHE10_03305 [Candidatus Paceibacterota bacterium]|nr:hypothetical protein [Candidatus Paceibacterota bacterium]
MNKKYVWISVVLIIIAAAAYYMTRVPYAEVPVDQNGGEGGIQSPIGNPGGSVSSGDQGTVEAVVSAFGKAMRNVSILAPTTTAAAAFDANYGSLISPELLQQWKASPSKAIGRMTSNPWPESIGIVSVSANTDGSYTVQGNVVEVTTTDPNDVAAAYPVTLTLEKRDASWRITNITRGAYSNLPQRVTITGNRICLPHKDTTGPQTLECAFGIKADDGKNYGLDTSLLSATGTVDAINSATRVRVTGALTPVEMLNSNFWQRYDIAGILQVTSAQVIQ